MQAQYGHKKSTSATLWPWLVLAAGLMWGACVFFWFSGRIGALYGFNPALGMPIQVGGFVGYSPLTVWAWPETVWTAAAIEPLIQRSLMVFAGPPMLVFLIIVAGGRGQKPIKDLHGSAYWAGKKEIKEMGYLDGQGVYVGGFWDAGRKRQLYLRHNGPEHILCFAPTRSGKGVGLILPTLLSWPDSSVVLDIKGENWALTSGFLKSQGHTLLRFDPADADRQSSRFNPLEEVRLSTGRAISDVQQLATMILDPDGKGLSDYWEKAAFGFFSAAILHGMIVKLADEGRSASLYDISVMLEDHKLQSEAENAGRKNDENASGAKKLFEKMMNTDHAGMLRRLFPEIEDDLTEAAHVFIAAGAAGMLAKAPKEMAGVVSQATSNMSLYRDPIVARNTACCDFRIADLMHHETPLNLYLVVSPADIDRTRPLFRIFVSQLSGRLMEKMEFSGGGTKAAWRHRLLLMFDEFTSLGRLAIIERAVAYMAGYGIKGYFIVQSTKQLNKEYSADNALMENCHVRIAYAPNTVETAELLSKMTGTTTVVQRKKSISSGKGGRSVSYNVQEVARPLLTPDECMRLPGIRKSKIGLFGKHTAIESGDMLIFTAGHPAIYGKQILHFVDPTFLARASMPPAAAESLYFRQERIKAVKMKPVVTESTADVFLRYLDDLPEGIAEGI